MPIMPRTSEKFKKIVNKILNISGAGKTKKDKAKKK